MNDHTLLIIEDRKTLALNYADWLRVRGWKPQVAFSGAQGIEAYQATHFDVVLLDVRLPGMDGFEVFARLREIDPDVCVVFHTAYGDIPSAVKALKLGGMDFVEKPVANDVLLEKLRLASEGKRNAIEARAKQKAEAETKMQAQILTLAAGMAHKINGKLAAIRANQGVLEKRWAEKEWREQAICRTQEICDICHASLRVFTMLVKKHEMPVALVPIEEMLQQAAKTALFVTGYRGDQPERRPPKLEIATGLSVWANFDILEAALECLVENAVDSSAPDGEITVAAAAGVDGLINIRVEDKGHGFQERLLQKQIEPFTSTRSDFGHLGFGLYFATEVAKLYGGELSYGNRPDGGAFVNFALKQKSQPNL
jgi:FixJ family two-component response regulator/anti-sigma regulatory factor (Ser/Thr protein kinase)